MNLKNRLTTFFPAEAKHRLPETIFHILLAVGLGLIFLLFVSGSQWEHWPASTDYYDQQATAFLHGQTYLRTEPDPRLAALPNPYSPKARAGMEVLGDISYYQGRYYLYWGPAPALGIALLHTVAQSTYSVVHEWQHPGRAIEFVRILANAPMGDNVVVFWSAIGILVCLILLMCSLRNRFFPALASRWFFATLAVVILSTPLAWMLNRPMIYEAAISAGQMFFLGGLAIGLPILYSLERTSMRLLLASACWALAIGSRLTLAVPIGVLVLFFAIAMLRGHLSLKAIAIRLFCLLGPLFVGVALLGAFNFARFGSVWESGFRYQLGALDYTQSSNATYQLSYIPFNLYNYLLRPFSFQSTFPFLIPGGDNPTAYPFPLARPPIYYVEPTVGVFLVAPILLCIFGLCLSFRQEFHRRLTEMANPSMPTFRFIWIALAAAAIGAFLPLIAYWYCTERFILDFLPLGLLCAACGAWTILDRQKSISRWAALVAGILFGLGIWSVVSNLLLAVTGYGSHF
jgi:hypothetical protein